MANKKPRWVDVIAVAMQQLVEITGSRSFKVAEVADQISNPELRAHQEPAIDSRWLTGKVLSLCSLVAEVASAA
jgi:hypothetical protein